ncbi:ABC transporter permease subunit [Paenibacillus albidus]|uniref:ABC transporter permease subunit n=1 Tax=Paenibacillus albidus TaxID=2041023 RepID=UPI001BEBF925|nr:ABC transporter permease subunit [Paenibacillus albidus]MBT2292809.1 ABC transporter permease subunit [Paenibacillus albidus]
MLNLMKSEQYRFVRAKSYYYTGLIYILLIAAATIGLKVVAQSDSSFPYANEQFIYLNVLSMMPVIFVLLFIFPLILMGEDRSVLKNTVAYGYSRQTIYNGKLVITLAGFILFSLVLVAVSVLIASTMVSKDEPTLAQYLSKLLNLLPVMTAGITTYFCLASIMKKNVRLVIMFQVIQFFPYFVLGYLQGRFSWAKWLREHQPVYYLLNAYDEMTYPAWETWAVGGSYTLVFYLLGLYLFTKEEF